MTRLQQTDGVLEDLSLSLFAVASALEVVVDQLAQQPTDRDWYLAHIRDELEVAMERLRRLGTRCLESQGSP